MVGALFYCNIIVYGKIRNPDITKAGDGNRTHVSSLEGWCSTIELRPQGRSYVQLKDNTKIFASCQYFCAKNIKFTVKFRIFVVAKRG